MTIVSATLARNDADKIGRLLQSVAPIADEMLVIDTGSDDDTAEVAASHGATVLWREWVNAGVNRTELVTVARDRGDYVLALDSDEELMVGDDLPDLDAPCYLLNVNHLNIRFGFPKLLRSDIPWHYVGRAHEYLAPLEPERRPLTELEVVHHHDRADTFSKLAEVKAQLQLALMEDPGDARSVFYLAQTCRDMGDTVGAINFYGLRARMGGWEEEAWYAAYEAARLSRDPRALVEAWERRPWRYEPLYELSRLALELAAQTQPDPGGDMLFVHDRPET